MSALISIVNMNASTLREVLHLPLSHRKRNNLSRTRKGYHVFLSRYFIDCYSLMEEEKVYTIEQSGVLGNVMYDWGSDMDSVDSTDTPLRVRHIEVM